MAFRFFLVVSLIFTLPACTELELASHMAKQIPIPGESKSVGTFKIGNPYKIAGRTYYPKETYHHSETGIASWYGPNFHGKTTANGEIFDQYELTAAHRTLQIPSLVRVTNLENGRSLIVRVNDRGPFSKGRVIDLSKRAAELLNFKNQGTAKVRLDLLSEESRQIAEAAKRGEDTSGVEIAMNENRVKPPSRQPSRQPVIQQAALQPQREPITDLRVPGHIKNGNFLPDPVVSQVPVIPTGIYVQAGSFSQARNAQNFASSLRPFGPAKAYRATINDQQFYRVRLGPLENVQKADALLQQLASAGHDNAMIVID